MSDPNPKSEPTHSIASYEEFEGIMADSLVRARIKLGRLEADFDSRFPRDIAKSLSKIGESLRPVIAFLVDNANDLIENTSWNLELEDFFFDAKNRRIKNRGEVEGLESETVGCDPIVLANAVTDQYTYFCAKVILSLYRVGDDNRNIPPKERLPKNSEIIKELNFCVDDLQRYIEGDELRPAIHAEMLPVFEAGEQGTEIDDLNLASFAISVASAVADGEYLKELAADIAFEVEVNLRSALQEIFRTMPELVQHIEKTFFSYKRTLQNPWPFTTLVKEWNDTLFDSNRSVPERMFNDENVDLEIQYLRALELEPQDEDARDQDWSNPFDVKVEYGCDDDGIRAIEFGFISPGLVPKVAVTTPYTDIEWQQSSARGGLVRSIINN